MHLQEQEVRTSAEASRTLTDSGGDPPTLPKGAVMEAIAVSEEFDSVRLLKIMDFILRMVDF